MSKWLARLAALDGENAGSPMAAPTDRTDKRGLPSVLAVVQATDDRETPTAPTDRASARLVRLRRWGWPEAEALALSQRLAHRDADDDRVTCADCRHCRPGQCGNHRRAGLTGVAIGRDWAALLQRCSGFADRLRDDHAQPQGEGGVRKSGVTVPPDRPGIPRANFLPVCIIQISK